VARPLLLVTGIAEGLGAEVAKTFARAGHDVIGLSRSDRCSQQIRQSVEQHDGCYVHVPHLVLDGLIDEVQTDRRFGTSAAVRMSPAAIAQACLDLSAQPPSAWTHEMDLRPFSERF